MLCVINMLPLYRIKEIALGREREKIEKKKYGEKLQCLQDQYQWEQKMEREKQAKQKSDLMHAHRVGSQQHTFSSWKLLL